jgi:lysophospholipase L1-like esterase
MRSTSSNIVIGRRAISGTNSRSSNIIRAELNIPGLKPTTPAFLGLEAATLGVTQPPQSPPTITLSKAFAKSQIPNGVEKYAIDGPDFAAGVVNTENFRYVGMAPGAVSNPLQIQYVGKVNITAKVPGASMGLIIEFVVDGSEFEIIESCKGDVNYVTGHLGSYRLSVNGVPVIPVSPTDVYDGKVYRRLVSFNGVRAQRLIRLEYDNAYFGGVTIGPNDSLYFPYTVNGARAIILGDSFTEGTGADAWFTGYARMLGELMGWDAWESGVGGTGYLAPGLYDLPFPVRVEHDVISYNPEFVLIAGGFNDLRYGDPTKVGATAAAIFEQIQSGLPNATIIVIGPWWPDQSKIATSVATLNSELNSVATKAGLPFVDVLGWFTGSSNSTSASPGTGNTCYYIGEDGTHPTQAGHQYLAERFASEIMALLNYVL